MNAKPPRVDPAEIYARRQLDEIAARWDRKAGLWDQELQDPSCHFNEDEAYQRFLVEAKRLIALRPEFCARNGVSDAGCGTGLVLAEVTASFAWGVGVDISGEMIRLAQTKRIPRASFLVGDCFGLPTLSPPAGAIFSRGVLLSHYGAQQGRELLKAARAALVSRGFVVFDFLNEAARTRHSHRPQAKTFFSRGEAVAMAREVGFSKVTVLGEEARRVLLMLAET